MSGQGITPAALKARYDVPSISEDRWHTHAGKLTQKIVAAALAKGPGPSRLLLNAGCGCHPIEIPGWNEVAVDLFSSPLVSHKLSVRATIEALPFAARTFGAVVCVGEVLGYCDPSRALNEFARILVVGGTLICDFGSSRSWKYRFTESYGRAADLIVDRYNGSPERLWVYDPKYIKSILLHAGFDLPNEFGTHAFSAIARRIGVPPGLSVVAERWLGWVKAPLEGSDVTTFVSQRRPT